MGRSIVKVIEQLSNQIQPQSPIIESIERIKRDAGFTAPEIMYVRWEELHSLLLEEFPVNPPSEQAIVIWAIFTDRTVSDMRRAFFESVTE